MQPIPKGVTGFDAPEEGVQVKQFTAAIHDAARRAGCFVEQVRAADGRVTPNFHEILVRLRDGTRKVRVLCNAHYPIVAFASPIEYEGDVRIRFVDCLELSDALSSEFSVLSNQDACAPVSEETVALLSEVELKQIRYWRPQRIGDVIFNYWD